MVADGAQRVEPAGLATFRRELRAAQKSNVDHVFFGDHDFSQIVELRRIGDDRLDVRPEPGTQSGRV